MSGNNTWLEDQLGNQSDNEKKFEFNWRLKCKIYGSRIFGWTFISAFAIIIPILVYYFVVDLGTYISIDSFTCLVNESFRVSCGKVDITSEDCVSVGCCFDSKVNFCYHYLPSRYSYDHDGTNHVVSRRKTPFGTKAIDKLKITVNELNSDQVSVTLHGVNSSVVSDTLPNKNYRVTKVKEKLMVEIYRNTTGELLLSTTKGPLIASDDYWEWTLYLTNQSLFGLNQTLISLKRNSNFSMVLYHNKNNHHSLPTFWAYTKGKFHGVSIKHDGPLEITILPSYLIVMRSLTGGNIELKLSLGPTPKLLHDQQLSVSKLPPFWMMGVHICRKTNKLDITEIIKQFTLADEADSYCVDDNLLMALMADNLTNINILNDTLTKSSKKGKKFLLSVPPQVSVDSTLHETLTQLDLVYTYNLSSYVGKYLKKKVVYPDYSHNRIEEYMDALDSFLNKYISVNIDGFMLSANWPLDDSFEMWNITDFPYFPNIFQEAMSYTIPWNATSGDVLHIEKHNSYGPSQLKAFENYYNNTNIQFLSATRTYGQTEPNFIQNIETTWDNLNKYLDNILFDSISGNHFVSLPVCGDTSMFNSTIQETLCIRWYLVAATMPMFRITSLQPWREPASLADKYAEKATKEALRIRKMFLPYYYTILSRNEPLIRPMFYDYYENTTTFSMKNQYMIGENILVSRPMTSDLQRLRIYLPSRVSVWYELFGGSMYTTNQTDSWIAINLRETDFVAFVAQGTVVPLVENNNINAIIGLNCTHSPCQATGTLFLDTYMHFNANESSITVSKIDMHDCIYTLGYIKLYHYDNKTNYQNYYTKNVKLCNGTSITIYYEESN
ncbi:lysosomal alpha-glucosidase [Leptinotarsa decemlineata]|uniref:lysosomal alpha-glucosidase n=1 Tax=Leptinotarsa decemlineata TaxID=7539 RepID=UPI003D309741